MLRGRRTAERCERRAHRAAVHVVLREQPARESARRAVFKTEFAHDRRNEAGKLGGAAAENIKADRVPLRRASQHERRERGDVALAAAGEIDKIKYALNAAAADSVHHRAVERIFRKTAVLGLERCGKRVPAERVAAVLVNSLRETLTGCQATISELVDTSRIRPVLQTSQVKPDVNGVALACAVVETGALSYRVGPVADDPVRLRKILDDQLGRADMVVTTGGIGSEADDVYEIVLREMEIPLFVEVLNHCEGNQSRAAALLGIHRATLRKKLKDYGLA